MGETEDRRRRNLALRLRAAGVCPNGPKVCNFLGVAVLLRWHKTVMNNSILVGVASLLIGGVGGYLAGQSGGGQVKEEESDNRHSSKGSRMIVKGAESPWIGIGGWFTYLMAFMFMAFAKFLQKVHSSFVNSQRDYIQAQVAEARYQMYKTLADESFGG